jgi:hypothetical protein
MTLADLFKTTAENQLMALDGLLAKAADAGGDALLAERLAPDMLPLAAQVRIACDQVSVGLRRIAGGTFGNPDDDDATIAAARQRIAANRAALAAQDEAAFAAEDAPVEIKLPNGMIFSLTAAQYVRDFVVPQLGFHVTAAYAILRMKGLAIGKGDYLPYMHKYVTKGPDATAA